MKRTPLFNAHQRLGAKLIEFGGWEMPVQYTSITDEHLTVRNEAGIFDISHMGEVQVSGPQAEAFLNQTLTNDIRKLEVGTAQYTLMCNERGGVIDDLYAYRLGGNEYLLIINASRIEADYSWFQTRLAAFDRSTSVVLTNISDAMGAVAIQGPRVIEFMNDVSASPAIGGTKVARPTELKKNQIAKIQFAGKELWIARTGYTGEDGFEIVAPATVIEAVWNKLMDLGKPFGLKPCGLGARDTLRTEVCYPLYGQELDEETTPIEAGVGFFVALTKGDFVGRAVLANQKANGMTKKLVAFKMTEKCAPPRSHYPIWSSGSKTARIGHATSGTQSPSLGIGIGLGYVPPEFAKPQTLVDIEIRGKRSPAVIVPKPIYSAQK
jgi:aminomethyltransferase